MASKIPLDSIVTSIASYHLMQVLPSYLHLKMVQHKFLNIKIIENWDFKGALFICFALRILSWGAGSINIFFKSEFFKSVVPYSHPEPFRAAWIAHIVPCLRLAVGLLKST